MIKSENGSVMISASLGVAEVMADLTVIIKACRKTFAAEYGEEEADLMITKCGQDAYKTPEEIIADAERLYSGGEECLE